MSEMGIFWLGRLTHVLANETKWSIDTYTIFACGSTCIANSIHVIVSI